MTIPNIIYKNATKRYNPNNFPPQQNQRYQNAATNKCQMHAKKNKENGSRQVYMVRTPVAISRFIRLRYCSRNCIRPKVPRPTARKKNAVHTQVMTRPTGKKARRVPGRTKGISSLIAAEAEARAASRSVTGVPASAKTPLMNVASSEASPVVSSPFRADSVILGVRSGRSDSLWSVSCCLLRC